MVPWCVAGSTPAGVMLLAMYTLLVCTFKKINLNLSIYVIMHEQFIINTALVFYGHPIHEYSDVHIFT